MTYYQYVKELRLKKVCFYLRFTELQMKEIAVRVGFSSAQNLARVLSEGEADVHVGFPQAIGVGTPKRSGAPGHTQQPYGLNPAKDTTKKRLDGDKN